MKALMYHYVREPDSHFPFFKFLHIDDFKKQLDYLASTIGFVPKAEFLNALSTGQEVEGAILTFDDGFKDHYEYVFPELVKRDLWGIFYIPSKPYISKEILEVHKVHLLLGRFGGSEILDLLNKLVTDDILIDQHISSFHELTYKTQKEEFCSAEVSVKKILNYFIGYQHRKEVIDQLMYLKFGEEFKALHSGFYMSVNELNEMADKGMIIGSHTVSHPVMSKLEDSEQEKEIEQSFDFITQNIKQLDHKTFCYPHGGFHTFTDVTEQILFKNKVLYSFNVEYRDIITSDLLGRPQALPRYDCNQFPFGSIWKG